MTEIIASHLTQLVKLVSNNCSAQGVTVVTKAEAASQLEMLWLQHLSKTQLTGTADCLLDGTASAIREAVACVALGLVRPALNSLRLQIDLTLGWLYFKDHPVEWARVQTTGDGFKLKTDLLKYMGESYDRFSARFAILRECKTRTQDDPYRLLSAHVHGQSQYVLPQVQLPADIVASVQAQDEALQLQQECAEFINDILWAVYAARWASLPGDLLSALDRRFKTPVQRENFFHKL